MTTIDQISQVLSDHARNEIDEGEALRRVHGITCGSARSPELVCILIEKERAECDRQEERVRKHAAGLTHDAQRVVADMNECGPESVSTTWISMHLKGLIDAKAKFDAARERVRELETFTEE